MLKVFRMWLEDVEANAVANKKESAKDPMLWKEEIWRAPSKDYDIKKKFRDEMEKLADSDGQKFFSKPSYETDTGDWLYDFVSRRLDKDKNLLEMYLAMEIEMSNPKECDSKYDFNKLLQADSRYKIFVFQHNSRENVLAGMTKLKDSAEKYSFRSDSDFLLCGWSTSDNKFFFDEFKARRASVDDMQGKHVATQWVHLSI